MAEFSVHFDGEGVEPVLLSFATVDEARNAAISLLGAHLKEHPDYAWKKHWRVDLKDHTDRLILHVIVATVDAAQPINFASFE